MGDVKEMRVKLALRTPYRTMNKARTEIDLVFIQEFIIQYLEVEAIQLNEKVSETRYQDFLVIGTTKKKLGDLKEEIKKAWVGSFGTPLTINFLEVKTLPEDMNPSKRKK